MIQLPPAAAMDRLTLPFSPSDLLMRYPLGLPPATQGQWPSDLKVHLPPCLGEFSN